MQTSDNLDSQNQELSTQDCGVSRRRFLVAGTMAGLSAGFMIEPLGVFAGQQPRVNRNFDYGRNLPDAARQDPVYGLTRSRFNPLLGDQFIVNAEEAGKIRLNLIRINDLDQPFNSGQDLNSEKERENELSFSLLFFGPQEPSLSQQTAEFKHRSMADFKVLIVPVGNDDNGQYYEVVFNRSHA